MFLAADEIDFLVFDFFYISKKLICEIRGVFDATVLQVPFPII